MLGFQQNCAFVEVSCFSPKEAHSIHRLYVYIIIKELESLERNIQKNIYAFIIVKSKSRTLYQIVCFMTKKDERRITNILLPNKKIIKGEDMQFEVEKEPWVTYKLSDGTRLNIKLIVGKISRGIEPNTGNIFRHPVTGEPYYSVLHNVLISADVPESLMK